MTKFNSPLIIFVFYFCSTLTIGILVQFLILPIIFPHLHAGNGLLIKGDWNTFHMYAVQLKNLIDKEGWSNYNIFYMGQTPAGIAGFFYTTIYPKPISVLPLNCFYHSIGGLVLFFIINNLTKNNTIAFISSSTFVFFPTSLLWYTQIHKDTFFHPAILMFVLSWIILISFAKGERDNFFIKCFFLTAVSLSTIYFSRPYFLDVFNILIIILTFILLLNFIFRYLLKNQNKISLFNLSKIFFYLLLINSSIFFSQFSDFTSSAGYSGAVDSMQIDDIVKGDKVIIKNKTYNNAKIKNDNIDKNYLKNSTESQNVSESSKKSQNVSESSKKSQNVSESSEINQYTVLEPCNNGKIVLEYNNKKIIENCEVEKIRPQWEETKFLPDRIDILLKQLFLYREYFFIKQSNANMTFGHNYHIENFSKILQYIPVAAFYGYLSPFPNKWFGEGSTEATSMMRLIMSFEMMIFYLLIPFILFQIFKNILNIKYLFIFLICNTFILLPAYIVPNVGVLIRHRYSCYMLLVAIGLSFLLNLLIKRKNENWNNKQL